MSKVKKRTGAIGIILLIAALVSALGYTYLQREKEKGYSFIWMSDTQYYSESYPNIVQTMTQWIKEQVDKQSIEYVFHTGDLTNDGTDEQQWTTIKNALSVLDGVVPYSVLAGNKDADEDYSNYLKYFVEQQRQQNTSVEWCENGQASAQVIEVGTTKYLMVAIGWDWNKETIAWVNGVIAKYPDYITILSTHDYMKADGSLSKTGQKLYNQVVVPNASVRLVLCGHKSEALQKVDDMDDNQDGVIDRKVYQLMADYQDQDNGGNGFLRILTVKESEGKLEVQTYSPYLKQYNCYKEGKDEFTIDITDWFEKE